MGGNVRQLDVAFGRNYRPDAAAVDIGDPEVPDQRLDIDNGSSRNAYLKVDVADVAALIFLNQVHDYGPAKALRDERRRGSLHVGRNTDRLTVPAFDSDQPGSVQQLEADVFARRIGTVKTLLARNVQGRHAKEKNYVH